MSYHPPLTGINLINAHIRRVHLEMNQMKGQAVEALAKNRKINGAILSSQAQALSSHYSRLLKIKSTYLEDKAAEEQENKQSAEVSNNAQENISV